MEPKLADETFELDRCIECGICVAACGTKLMRPNFIGAVGLNRVARFTMDPPITEPMKISMNLLVMMTEFLDV